jgi:uncharacterized protein
VEIEWDEAKDAENITKHGLALGDAVHFEMSGAVVEVDTRYDYRETRLRAFGRIHGVGHCLVFTYRGQVIRVISFRREHDKEMRRYGI